MESLPIDGIYNRPCSELVRFSRKKVPLSSIKFSDLVTFKMYGFMFRNLRSFCEMVPFSSREETATNTLQASLAKSKSRTSIAGTGTRAKASLSSLIMALPTYEYIISPN